MASKKCPNCGACKECGAHPAPQVVPMPYPVYPCVPYRPQPWVSPWQQPRPYWGGASPNISIGGMQSSPPGMYQNVNSSMH